jgi:hypothetical protein
MISQAASRQLSFGFVMHGFNRLLVEIFESAVCWNFRFSKKGRFTEPTVQAPWAFRGFMFSLAMPVMGDVYIAGVGARMKRWWWAGERPGCLHPGFCADDDETGNLAWIRSLPVPRVGNGSPSFILFGVGAMRVACWVIPLAPAFEFGKNYKRL